jgi:hypothetical protein
MAALPPFVWAEVGFSRDAPNALPAADLPTLGSDKRGDVSCKGGTDAALGTGSRGEVPGTASTLAAVGPFAGDLSTLALGCPNRGEVRGTDSACAAVGLFAADLSSAAGVSPGAAVGG